MIDIVKCYKLELFVTWKQIIHTATKKHFFFLMIRRPPRSTQGVSSAASDVYEKQLYAHRVGKRPVAHVDRVAGVVDEFYALVIPVVLFLIHISEPTRPERTSYAAFCLKKKKQKKHLT